MKSRLANIRNVGELTNGLWSRYACWNGLWLLLFFVGMGVFFIGMPKFVDDYWYMAHLRSWFELQGITVPEEGGNILRYGIPLEGIVETWRQHYVVDNIRLPNLIIPFFLLFPKWIGSGIMLLLFAGCVFLVYRLAGIDWRMSQSVPISICGWMFLMPWSDHFGSMDYQFNYILSSWVALQLMLYLKRRALKVKVCCVSRDFIFALLLGFITGICHEGISVPFIAGLSVVIVLFRPWRNSGSIAAAVGLVLGICFLFMCPGMRSRCTDISSFETAWCYATIFQVDWLGMYIMFFTVLACLFKKRLRRAMYNPIPIFAVVNACIVFAISCATLTSGRSSLWLNTMAMTFILFMLARCTQHKARVVGYLYRGISVLGLVAVYVHLVYVDYYSLKFRAVAAEVAEDFSKHGELYQFGDVKTLEQMPLLCGYMPDQEYYKSLCWGMRSYYGLTASDIRERCRVIPHELRAVGDNDGEEIPGGGFRRLGDYLYIPACNIVNKNDLLVQRADISIDFGKGWTNCGSSALLFTSEKDGKEYVWLVPNTDWYVSHFKRVKRIRLKK